jgi:hypothetical protein
MGTALWCINTAIHLSGLHAISEASNSKNMWDWLIRSAIWWCFRIIMEEWDLMPNLKNSKYIFKTFCNCPELSFTFC